MFSCGLCGKYFSSILPFLNHKVQHADGERSVACDLCDTKVCYSRQYAFRQHYKTSHNVNLGTARQQRTTRSALKRKPARGSAASIVTVPQGEGESQKKKAVSLLSHSVVEQACETSENVETAAAALLSDMLGVSNLAPLMVSDGQKESDREPPAMVTTGLEASHCQSMEGETGESSAPISKNGSLLDIVGTCNPDQSSVGNTMATTIQHLPHESDDSFEPIETPDKDTTPAAETSNINTTVESKLEDFYFILVTNIVRGNSIIYGKEAFQCVHCDYKTYWKNALLKHMKSSHQDVLALHEYVEMRSTLDTNDQKLMKMSEYVETQTIFRDKARRDPSTKSIRRPRRSEDPGNYTCPNCPKVFNKWSYLRKHMRIHVSTNNFLCTTCGKAFKTNGSLNQHVKTHQKEEYSCAVCGFKSRVSVAIHAHRQFHNQGSVLCDVCGYAYHDRSTLSKHKRVHDPNRAYPCPYPECSWRFKTEMMRNAHFRAHTSEAKFKCGICGYVFRHKHHLRRHERQTHGVQHPGRTKTHKAKAVETDDAATNISLVVKHELTEEQFQFQNAIESTAGLLIPAVTDNEGNAIPVQYEVADLASMNVTYQTLLQAAELQKADPRTIFIPQTDCGQIIFQSAGNAEQS